MKQLDARLAGALIAAACTLACVQPALAQTPNQLNMTVEIANARKSNAAMMREYQWQSRVELLEAGQVKDTRIEELSYGANGQIQHTVLSNTMAKMPAGLFRRIHAEDQLKDAETLLKGVRSLLEQYTLPTEGKILDFINGATVTSPDAQGLLQLTGQNVIVTGDTFTMWVDRATWQPHHVKVQTFYQGNIVNLDATFQTLPSGLNHVGFAGAQIPSQNLSTQVQNYNYTLSPAAAAAAAARAARPAAPPPAAPPQAATAPAAAPAAATAAQRLPLGTVVQELPAGCVSTPVGGISYFYCGGNFYRAAMQGNNLVYVTAQP